MNHIHIHKDGMQLGPYTEEQIREGISQGRFHAGDLAWKEGLAEWQPVSTMLDLAPPPSPAAAGHVPAPTLGVLPPALFPRHAPGTCPLCGNGKHMPKAKPLYGQMVCKKCYYGFANRRQFAYLLDLGALYVGSFMAMLFLGMLLGASGAPEDIIGTVATLLPLLIIPVWLCKDGFSGQSPGKAICGVRVIDAKSGEPGGMGASFKRNLPLIIPVIPLVIAIQMSKGRRMGDGWANTKVILKKHAANPVFGPDLQ